MNKLKTYIINMKNDTERKKYMQEICMKYSNVLEIEFIDAVNGYLISENEIDKIYNKKKTIDKLGRELKRGELGCILSHLDIYNRICKEKIRYALVLEDDIFFEESFEKYINLIQFYPNDWDIVLYGHYSYYLDNLEIASPTSIWRKFILPSKKETLYRLSSYGYGTHGYLISFSGAAKLISELKDIYAPIDYYTSNRSFVNTYAVSPSIIKVNTKFESSININAKKVPFFKKFKTIWLLRNFLYKFFF